jgi:adenylate kinase
MASKDFSKVIFSFFGPPGSGKGTVAEKCKKQLGYKTLSSGKLCRKHVALGTEFGKMLDTYLSVGRLIPDKLISQMVTDWLDEAALKKVPIIIDGYPRTQKQAELFFTLLQDRFSDYCFCVISFEISDEEILQRLNKRLVCENKSCQTSYSPVVSPKKEGICDQCGSRLVRRDDDKIEIIKERLRFYPGYKKDLFSYYDSVGLPIIKFDVSGLKPDQVFDKFVKIQESLISCTKNE